MFKGNKRQLRRCYYFLPITRHTIHTNAMARRRGTNLCAEQWRDGKYPLSAPEAATSLSTIPSACAASMCAAQLHLHLPPQDHVPAGTRPVPRDPQVHALFQLMPLKSDILQDPKKPQMSLTGPFSLATCHSWGCPTFT